MATTLSYGFIIPKTGDKGPVIFPAMESNITQLNNHTHDGLNSAPIPAYQLLSSQSTIPASGWTSFGGAKGEYRQLVQMSPGYNFDQDNISIRTADGQYAYPKIVRNDPTSFYIYCNDPTVTFAVNYGG